MTFATTVSELEVEEFLSSSSLLSEFKPPLVSWTASCNALNWIAFAEASNDIMFKSTASLFDNNNNEFLLLLVQQEFCLP
jgi:hypothetical protein